MYERASGAFIIISNARVTPSYRTERALRRDPTTAFLVIPNAPKSALLQRTFLMVINDLDRNMLKLI
jgi:hypothetical protein